MGSCRTGAVEDRDPATLADPGNTVFVSAVSLREIVVKWRVGKPRANIGAVLLRMAPYGPIAVLGLLPRHLMALSRLRFHPLHRDPFDHLIIAQAITEDMMLVTADQRAPLYPVQLLVPYGTGWLSIPTATRRLERVP